MLKLWKWKLMLVMTLPMFLVVGCSNDSVTSTGTIPINQAPPPPTGPYAPPTGYVPPTGLQPGQPNFYPNMPQNYPSQYTPFVPIDNYMRRTPPQQNYWHQFWGGWQNYANYYGYDQYDFPTFWFEYCPQQWDNTDYADLYNYFDQNVYFWVDFSTQFQQNLNPNHFWQNYQYMPYQPIDNYGYCDYYCDEYYY